MKPSIPKGTRDFSPQEMVKRNYIFDTIRKVYQSYGYQPIETPAMENLETLMGKYGEEGDRLIFKILNSGNPFNDFEEIDLETLDHILADVFKQKNITSAPREELGGVLEDARKIIRKMTEKALRYDLTVPFARYVVQHRNDITFPFKRYQIQPVWRADRPQKGRYREFYQCDADVIGSDSLLNEVELIQIIDEVFTKLGVPVIIKINNRKILQGIAEYIGAPDRMIDIATAIDKVDKIGIKGVIEELKQKGFTPQQIEKLTDYLLLKRPIEKATSPNSGSRPITERYERTMADIGWLQNRLTVWSVEFPQPPIINEGAIELKNIIDKIYSYNKELAEKIEFDASLARGLNYYTGTIIEVKADPSKSTFTGSICGGGRYDDLTGIFGLPGVSGVGISFGADRIYDVMEELNLFPTDIVATTKVLLINFGEKEAQYCLKVLKDLHTAGISSELYPDAKKINKQFEYADKRNIPYVLLIGADEINRGVGKVRNMISKEEIEMSPVQLIEYFKAI